MSLRLEQCVCEMASAWSGEISALKRTIQLFTFMRLLFVKMSSTLQLITASWMDCCSCGATASTSEANSELIAVQSPRSSLDLASQLPAKEGKTVESGEAMSRSVGDGGRSERASSQKSRSMMHFHSYE